MAATPIEFIAPTGLTLTLKLFALDSDTLVSALTATEATNRKGFYLATEPAATVGLHHAIAFDENDSPVAAGYVDMADDTETHRAFEWTEPSSESVASAIFDDADAIETGWTLRKALRVIFAALAGKSSGHLLNAPVYRNVGDTKDRITAVTTADGRTTVTLDGD